jgi:tetratricopeptide (TPR) repeat protein
MKAILSRFTPSIMPHEDLEAIFVQREKLVGRLVELVRDSALTPSKHQTLLIGPRGVGKTHIIALVYHRIRKMEDLDERLMIAWLREEEWGVTSFLDLLLRIFRSLMEEEEYYDPEISEQVESLYLQPETAEDTAAKLLKEFVGERALVILAENLGDLFDGLGDEGQKQLRAYLQENPFCTILATAQSLFNGVSLQTSPFYGFFRIHHLEELDIDEATDLLKKIADLVGDRELSSFIGTPRGRSRIRAVHHLAGGNHRVYVIFSDFLTRESLDELVDSVMRTLDDLTPYYQARMWWLSAQQRKIVEFLCGNRGAVPVKEIAGRCFMTQQTASSQLKDLREKGYVSSVSVGRESYYELREPLMRLCGEVKKQRGDPIRLLVDFLRIWYSREELEQHLNLILLEPDAALEREYVLHTLGTFRDGVEDPLKVACLRDLHAYFAAHDFDHALKAAEELVELYGRAQDWAMKGCCLRMLGRYEEALDSCNKAIEISQDNSRAWCCRGEVLEQLGRYDEALDSLGRSIELDSGYEPAWYFRGMVLGIVERYDESLDSFNKAIKLNSNRPNIWHYRGIALNNLRRYDEALESLNKAVELEASDGEAWFTRGMVQYHLGKWDELLVSLDKAIDLGVTDGTLHFFRGSALTGLGRYDEALTSYDRAIELDMEGLCVLFGRTECLLALERWDEGYAALDDALQRFADDMEHVAGHTKGIVCSFLTGMRKVGAWRSRLALLMELYDKHKVISTLGQGLVGSISALVSPMVSDAAAREWLEIWKELAGDRDEFQIPLRLLNAAVRYRETKDRRVLLRIAVEERKILEPLLEGVDA